MTDPLARCGGLRKTGTSASAISTDATTVPANQSERVISSLAPATKLSFGQQKGTRRSLGDTRAIEKTVKPASNAVSSATKAPTSRRSLSDRLTLSLISSGLVCGITPSLTRKQSGQPIQVLALDTPDGGDAARRNVDSSSLSACDRAAKEGANNG